MGLRVKWHYLKTLLFENRNARQTVVKNTFWLGVSNFSGRVIRAGLIIYAARVLGTEGYGVFSYALGLAGFFSLFSDIGVSAILTREISRHPESLEEYVATSLVLKAGLLVLSLLLVIFGAPFISKIPGALPLMPLAALLLVFDGFRDFALSITRAKEKMEVEGIVSVITNVAITVLGFAILLIRPSPFAMLTGYTLGSGVGTLVSFWVLREFFRSPIRNFRRSLLKSVFFEALPFALMGILGAVMFNTDTVLLGWLTNAQAVGLYSAAQRPVQIITTMPGLLAAALFPSFARLALDKSDRFRTILERAIGISILLALPIVGGGILLGPAIVHLLFGAEYAGAAAAFMILLLTALVSFPSGFVSNAVFAHGAQKSFVGSLAFGAIGNLILNVILIPKWGIVGSSVATIGALVISQGYLWWKLQTIQPFAVLPYLKKTLPASVLMGALVFFLQRLGVPLIPNIILGGIFYFALLWMLKENLLAYFRPPALTPDHA